MSLIALSPGWTDFFTAGGFAVAVVGFAYTIYQVRKTKSAAEAAREAIREEQVHNRTAFQRYAASHANRLLALAIEYVDNESWEIAKIRVRDLAEYIAHLQTPSSDVTEIVEDLREHAHTLSTKARGAKRNFPVQKWRRLVNRIQRLFDQALNPFPEVE